MEKYCYPQTNLRSRTAPDPKFDTCYFFTIINGIATSESSFEIVSHDIFFSDEEHSWKMTIITNTEIVFESIKLPFHSFWQVTSLLAMENSPSTIEEASVNDNAQDHYSPSHCIQHFGHVGTQKHFCNDVKNKTLCSEFY